MSESKELTPSEKMRAALPDEPRSRIRPWLGVLTGILSTVLFIGCCLCGLSFWWFRPLIKENPDQARTFTQQMVDISIPEPFQAQGLIDWNLAFLMHLRGVYYQRYVGDGVLTLLEINTRLSHDESIRQHIRKTLLKEGPGGTELVIDRSQTHRELFEIAGQQVPFTFEVARDGSDLTHLVEGVFDGKSGQVLLSLRVDDLHWKNEEDFKAADAGAPLTPVPIWVRRMIESIGKAVQPDLQPVLQPTPAPAPTPTGS